MVGQGGHTMPRRGLGLARAWGWCGPPVAPLRLSFWLPGSSDDICEETLSDAGQGHHTMPRRGQGMARA